MGKNILKEAAIEFCKENISDWDTLDEDGKAWYIKKVSVLLLEDKEIKLEMFKTQVN